MFSLFISTLFLFNLYFVFISILFVFSLHLNLFLDSEDGRLVSLVSIFPQWLQVYFKYTKKRKDEIEKLKCRENRNRIDANIGLVSPFSIFPQWLQNWEIPSEKEYKDISVI